MKIKLLLFFSVLLIFSVVPSRGRASINATRAAVTYGLSGGRLGDCLLSYIHAQWVAYKKNLALVHVPFKYSDEFNFQYPDTVRKYANKYQLNVHDTMKTINPHSSILYTCPYFPESRHELTRSKNENAWMTNILVDWEDPAFLEVIRENIQPKRQLDLVVPPEGYVSVAVHVRRGGGFDGPLAHEMSANQKKNKPDMYYADINVETKFAPKEYYIDQIKFLSHLHDNQPMYVHIFTDDKDPASIIETYRNEINLPNIEFGYRECNNSHDLNVLEDFFSMGNFDCLVRNESNFSFVASKVFKYQVITCPVAAHWEEGHKLVIDAVDVRFNTK